MRNNTKIFDGQNNPFKKKYYKYGEWVNDTWMPYEDMDGEYD